MSTKKPCMFCAGKGYLTEEDQSRSHRSLHCSICDQYDSHYMVTDTVWSEAGFSKSSKVCLSCLQTALHRPLRIEDFPDAPINEALRFGYRLGWKEADSGSRVNRENPDRGRDYKALLAKSFITQQELVRQIEARKLAVKSELILKRELADIKEWVHGGPHGRPVREQNVLIALERVDERRSRWKKRFEAAKEQLACAKARIETLKERIRHLESQRARKMPEKT